MTSNISSFGLKIIFLISILFPAFTVSSQTYDFTKITGNNLQNYGIIKTAPNGDIYQIIDYTGTIQLSTGISISSAVQNSCLVKYDGCGHYITHLNNISFPLAAFNSMDQSLWFVDNSGAVYTVNQNDNISPGNWSVVITKYSSNLIQLWQKHIPNLSNLYGLMLFPATDMLGGCIISGNILGSGNFEPVPISQISGSNNPASSFQTVPNTGGAFAFMVKLDTQGGYLWHGFLTNTSQPPNNSPQWSKISSLNSFTQTGPYSSNIYQAGYFNGKIDFLTPAILSCSPGLSGGCMPSEASWYFCKFSNLTNSLGFSHWSYNVTPPPNTIQVGNNSNRPIVVTSNNNMIFAHNITGNFWPTDITNTNSATIPAQLQDIVLTGLSFSGNHLFTKTISGTGNEEMIDLKTDGTGNIYLLGKFENTVSFSPGISLTATPNRKTFVAKYNPTGNFLWVKHLESDITFTGIFPDISGTSFILDATFQNAVDFNPDPLVSDIKTSNGGIDHAFIKFSTNNCPPICSMAAEILTGDEYCSNQNGGIGITNITGGTPPFTYQWKKNGIPLIQTGNSITGASAGQFDVVITDATGCSITETRSLQNLTTNLNVQTTVVNVTCQGPQTGQIILSNLTGGDNYTFTWTKNGITLPQTDQYLTNVTVGTYTVTIKDGDTGCSIVKTFTITQDPCPQDCCTGGQWKSKYIGWSLIKDKEVFSPSVIGELKKLNIPETEIETPAETPVQKNLPAKTTPANKIIIGNAGPIGPVPDRINITNCDAVYHLSQNGKYTLNADYQCGTGTGLNCTKTIKVTIQGPSGCTFNGTYNAPYTQTFTQDGNYTITYEAYCGTAICGTCTFTLTIDKNCCLNGKWLGANYQLVNKNPNGSWNMGTPQPLPLTISSPIPTYTAKVAVNVLNLNYQCTAGCAAGYKMIKRNTVTGVQTNTLLPAGQTSLSVYTEKDKQLVRIWPVCGSRQCQPMLLFFVACSDNSCKASPGSGTFGPPVDVKDIKKVN